MHSVNVKQLFTVDFPIIDLSPWISLQLRNLLKSVSANDLGIEVRHQVINLKL